MEIFDKIGQGVQSWKGIVVLAIFVAAAIWVIQIPKAETLVVKTKTSSLSHKPVFNDNFDDALKRISRNSGPLIREYDHANSEALCAEKWTDVHGLNERMFDYCLNQQSEGWEEANDIVTGYEARSWIRNLSNYARRKWTKGRLTDYNMYGYTIRQQTEAFETLNEMLSSGDISAGTKSRCFSKWLKPHEPNFNMVVYCFKNRG